MILQSMNRFLMTATNQFRSAGLILAFAAFLIGAALFNVRNSSGMYLLHMDELITFQELDELYHAKKTGEWIYHILDSDEHRYGRIMYYTTALVALIPANIFGDQGQIIATRMFMSLILGAGYLLLVLSFVKNRTLQLLAFLTLVATPFTLYYATVPKPEPFQVFAFGMFFYFLQKRGIFPFVYLWPGIAFGAKISAIVFLPALAPMFLHHLLSLRLSRALRFSLLSGGSFILGWFLGSPLLFTLNFNKYYQQTWQNTGHGSDNPLIGIGDWFQYTNLSFSYQYFFVVLILFTLFLSGIHFYFTIKTQKTGAFIDLIGDLRLILLISAILWMSAIFMKVDRLWGFYIQIPVVFLFLYIFSILDQYSEKSPWKIPSFLFAIAFFFPVFFHQLQDWKRDYSVYSPELARRKKNIHDQIVRTLNYEVFYQKKRLVVHYDPLLVNIRSDQFYQLEKFWGPYIRWDDHPDLIFLSIEHYQSISENSSIEDSVEKEMILKSRELFQKHTTKDCPQQSNTYSIQELDSFIVLKNCTLKR